jgi:hypothetical protein
VTSSLEGCHVKVYVSVPCGIRTPCPDDFFDERDDFGDDVRDTNYPLRREDIEMGHVGVVVFFPVPCEIFENR